MNLKSLPGVYEIVKVPSGRRYIGASRNIKTRYFSHFSALKRGNHHCSELQKDFSSTCEKDFVFRVLAYMEECLIDQIERNILLAQRSKGENLYNHPSRDIATRNRKIKKLRRVEPVITVIDLVVLRKTLRLTQAAIAKEMGVTQQTIRNIEKKRVSPSPLVQAQIDRLERRARRQNDTLN